MEHRHQAYYEISPARFWQSLSPGGSPSPSANEAPHPSLLNAMYLLACFFSGSKELEQYEPLFLERARNGLAYALQQAENLPHAIQAASLIAMYLHSRGRVLEGYYLACANARFAVGCGLHQIESPIWRGPNATGFGGTPLAGVPPLLEPPRDPIEHGERIHMWWQVWMVDQCSAVATNLPPALYDSADSYSRISTSFPPNMTEFETGSLQIGRNVQFGTISSLYGYDHHDQRNHFDGRRNALVVKATELFARAWKLSKHGTLETQLCSPNVVRSSSNILLFRCERRRVPCSVRHYRYGHPPILSDSSSRRL